LPHNHTEKSKEDKSIYTEIQVLHQNPVQWHVSVCGDAWSVASQREKIEDLQ